MESALLQMSAVASSAILVGFAIGFRRYAVREKFRFSLKEHYTPTMIALKALGIGTIISVSTVGGITAILAYGSGINTVDKFSKFSRSFVGDFLKPVEENDIDFDEESDEAINYVLDFFKNNSKKTNEGDEKNNDSNGK